MGLHKDTPRLIGPAASGFSAYKDHDPAELLHVGQIQKVNLDVQTLS
jgi:hypothetical protein